MSGPREKFPLLLAEATLSLYLTDDSGAPVLAAPIWFGACAENLRISEAWIGTETRPGGRKYPRRRAHVPQYSIDIERVWTLQKADLDDFRPGPGPYVLDILWEDEEDGYWLRRVFYGVTPVERSLSAGAADAEMRDGQQWHAEYYEDSNGGGTPPPVSSSVPLTVRWVGTDGIFELYTHDATTWSFTEASAGITTGRATMVYTPANQTGKFEIIFASGSTVALRITATQVLEVGTVVIGTASAADVPRLDFLIGNSRRASLTLTKKLFVFGMNEVAALVSGPSQFEMRAGLVLSLVLAADGARCLEVRESL